jgi:hypothetical protein
LRGNTFKERTLSLEDRPGRTKPAMKAASSGSGSGSGSSSDEDVQTDKERRRAKARSANASSDDAVAIATANSLSDTPLKKRGLAFIHGSVDLMVE